MAKEIILVVGGAKSGKTTFAQALAGKLSNRVTYIATAEARDGEMKERIERHRRLRPAKWTTLEVPLVLAKALPPAAKKADVILVDCLTLLISNLMEVWANAPDMEAKVMAAVEEVLATAQAVHSHIIFVANDVSQGLVPTNPLGRAFRDVAGLVNQRTAAVADRVYQVNCGLARELKKEAVTPEEAVELIDHGS